MLARQPTVSEVTLDGKLGSLRRCGYRRQFGVTPRALATSNPDGRTLSQRIERDGLIATNFIPNT